MSQSPSEPLRTLDYAPPDADGLPDWHEEAERLIDGGWRIRKLNRHFRKGIHSAKYFRKSAQRRYDLDTREAACVGCGVVERDLVARVEWSIAVPTRTLEFQLTQGREQLPLETWHTLCADCYNEWNRRLSRLVWVYRSVRFLYWIAIIGYVGWMIFGRGIRGVRGFAWPHIAFVSLLVASVIVASIYNWRLRAIGPRALRRLMPRGVRLTGPEGLYSIRELRPDPNPA